MNDLPAPRCSDVSRAVEEPLVGTATTTERWLLVETPGAWPRDVATAGALPERAHEALSAWLAATPRSRLLFLRRAGRSAREPLAFTVRSDESVREVRRIVVETHEDLADVDLDAGGEAVDRQLVLVCGHGSRDQCCAVRGTSVFGVLATTCDEEDLWISSHQGGHRFAANVLVLPAGIQLGRLDPDDALPVVERALGGRIPLAHYRGRTFHEPAVQAAEHAVREVTALDAVNDLRLAAVDGSIVRFRDRNGGLHAAEVEEIEGPVVPASCGARPEAHAVWRARVVSAVGRSS
jgi:hypothetical protein